MGSTRAAVRGLTEERGYTTLRGLIEPEAAARVRAAILSRLGAATPLDEGVLRVGDLLTWGQEFEALVTHPDLLAIAHALLGVDATLGAFSARVLLPGCEPGALHVDYPYWAMDSGMPVTPALMLQVIWMMEPFAEQNGATWLAPGSHRWRGPRTESRFAEHAVPVTGEAGDAIVSHGLLWHRTARNRSPNPRVAILINYTQFTIKPLGPLGRLSRGLCARASPQLRALLDLDHGEALRRRAPGSPRPRPRSPGRQIRPVVQPRPPARGPAARIQSLLRRRLSANAVRWLAARPGTLPERSLREWTQAFLACDRDRHIVVEEMKETIKASAPGVENLEIDVPLGGEIGFEHLSGLFASTTLDEYISTMNVRQSAYLFGLVRQLADPKVIEIGRHWGGKTVLIAAAMRGRGEFWSLSDPDELRWDLQLGRRTLDSPIEKQLERLFDRLQLKAHIVAGDPATAEIDAHDVDVVMIDGDHTYDGAMGDFERYGTRVRVGGAVLFDDAVYDDFSEPRHTADVKRVVARVAERDDYRMVKTVKRLVHFERVR